MVSFTGAEIDLPRTKLNADEQMCWYIYDTYIEIDGFYGCRSIMRRCSLFVCSIWLIIYVVLFSCSNLCRIPITDYHRRCPSCSYDLCLICCRDLREATLHQSEEPQTEHAKTTDLNILSKFPHWRSNDNGSIPCPPKEYGGCGYSSLNLSRIFKMNWVAKLVKNVEEMVSGCRTSDADGPPETGLNALRLCQYSQREASNDNYLYCPTSEELKTDGIGMFRTHWKTGEPIIVKQVFDRSSISSWDPLVIWRGILETTDENMKDDNRMVKAIDCLDGSEVHICRSLFGS